jgi:hypothetical protein
MRGELGDNVRATWREKVLRDLSFVSISSKLKLCAEPATDASIWRELPGVVAVVECSRIAFKSGVTAVTSNSCAECRVTDT